MNKSIVAILNIVVITVFSTTLIYAQSEDDFIILKNDLAKLKPGSSNFLLSGYAHSGLEIRDDQNTFVGGSFNPIFLWRQSEKLLFETELEIELEDESTILNLEYADLSYFLNDYLTLRLGKFLIPFGIFNERIHPRWINRLPSNPLGYSHDDQVGPRSQVGMELRGTAHIVNGSRVNYSIYLVNGPNLNDGDHEADEAGKLHYDNFSDNNKNKAIGGRIGILPFDDYSLEVGFSGQFGKVGDSESEYEDIGASLLSADISYVRKLNFLKSMIDIKGQWNRVMVDDTEYQSEENPDETYTFENISDAYFGQIIVKPLFVSNNFLKSLEFVARYSELILPEEAEWGGEKKQMTFGINYWLDWRTVIKLGYQTLDIKNEEASLDKINSFLIHWSIGF